MRFRFSLLNGALLDLDFRSGESELTDDDPPAFGFSVVGSHDISDDRMLDNTQSDRSR